MLSKAGVIFHKLGSLWNAFCLARLLGILQGPVHEGSFDVTHKQIFANLAAIKNDRYHCLP